MPKNWGAAFALAALIAVAVVGVSLSGHSPSQKNYTTAKYQQNTSTDDDNKPGLFVARAWMDDIGAWADKYHDAIEALSALGAFVFTAVLAVSTVLLWRATNKLWNEAKQQRMDAKIAADRQFENTQESIKLARNEFLSSHRPQMRLKHMWFATPDGERFFGQIGTEAPITVRLDIVNVGGTTGVVRLINFITLVVPTGESLPQRPPYNEDGVRQFATNSPVDSGYTMTSAVSDGRVLTEIEVQSIRLGHIRLYFVGTIQYSDAHDPPRVIRQTAFCRYLRFHSARPEDMGRFEKECDPDYEYED